MPIANNGETVVEPSTDKLDIVTPLDIIDEIEEPKVINITSSDIKLDIEDNEVLTEPNNEDRIEPSNKIIIWEAKRGSELKNILTEWASIEGIKLELNLSNNYKIDKDIFINGTFKNAISILFAKGIKNAPPYLLTESPSYKLKVEGVI